MMKAIFQDCMMYTAVPVERMKGNDIPYICCIGPLGHWDRAREVEISLYEHVFLLSARSPESTVWVWGSSNNRVK